MSSESILDLLANRRGAKPILYAPERQPLTAAQCLRQAEYTARSLREHGIGPADRVAVVLPNGPELAVSFLAVSSSAIFAPLNPQYPESEFRFFLEDLHARVLITQPGFSPAVEHAAAALGIPILGLRPEEESAAGCFRLEGPRCAEQRSDSAGGPAMLLHSSGTTARPKLIPLTHASLCASARNIARTLRLNEQDVCLNVMPLFHIHGLVGALLSSLAGDAAIYCGGGFNAFKFGRSIRESGATWCTAVPTMYQAILGRAGELDEAQRHAFRFLRSSSAHLHTPVWERLEEVFGCPALNSYGMTEASHQMTSNPLPPCPRKKGTTGPAAGPEVAIMDEEGALATPGARGEVVIRGETVTSGYLSPESAKLTAFRNGWFRTGDEGCLDEDGYLTLLGRLKEIINVGGEKVSPAEIDEVLMRHPAVAQAVAFPVPCPVMGEQIYAAVVLQGEAEEKDLRGFVQQRLARFKVPKRMLVVDEIPKGPTGKMQRIGLAARLGVGPV